MKNTRLAACLLFCLLLLSGCSHALPDAKAQLTCLKVSAPADGIGGSISIYTRAAEGDDVLSLHEKLSPGEESCIQLLENQYFTLSGNLVTQPY